jgi:AhpC/TSA family
MRSPTESASSRTMRTGSVAKVDGRRKIAVVVNPGPPVEVGHRAAEFELPAADRDGIVSLAHYRGKCPELLALFRGLYCPFCRRQMTQLSAAATGYGR